MSKHKGNKYRPNSSGTVVQAAGPSNDEYQEITKAKELLESENAELRAKLQPYLDVVGKAEKEAEEWVQLVKQDEARIRQEAKREQELEIERLLGTAREDAERIRSQADQERLKTKQETEGEVKAIRDAAQKKLDDASSRAERIIQDAETQAISKLGGMEAEFKKQTQEKLEQLGRDKSELEARETALAAREEAVGGEEQRLSILRDDLEFDLDGIRLRRTELDKRWNECSPDRLWMLEQNLSSERRKVESLSTVISELQAQCDHFRRDQENMAGRSAGALLAELESLRTRNREMEDQLASLPSVSEISLLRNDAAELRIVREQRDDLDRQLRAQLEATTRQDLSIRELNQAKVEAEAIRILNDELQKQIQLNSKALTQRTGACFPELLRIDSERRPARPVGERLKTSDGNLLTALTKHVRQYAASLPEKPLFYSEMDIRTFIAGLATSPLMILQGLSGTGKTSLPQVFAEAISGGHRKISVQSNWRDRHELLGYYNDFNKRFTETPFTQALYTAALPSEEDVPWLIVLDEVNLARIEYYFADFLSVLEDKDSTKWQVELVSFDPTTEGAQGPFHLLQNRMLQIPENTWFIGTANQDESTFEITDKVYDRAQVIDFQQRHQTNGARGRSSQRRVSLSELRGAFEIATSDSRNSLGDKEWAYLDRLDALLVSEFDITFGNRILDQIKSFVPVYVACGGTKSEAFDVQFSRKILRKLRSLHEASDKRALERLTEELTNPPSGWDPLKSSIEAVDRIKKRCI